MTRWVAEERALRHGVFLLLFHPDFDRTCEDCSRWAYNDTSTGMGDVMRKPAPNGPPVPRMPGTPTPCQICPKIPRGQAPKRANAVEFTPAGWRAYQHYLECRAVGQFPADPIVRWAARIIREVHDEWDRVPLLRLAARLKVDISTNGGR